VESALRIVDIQERSVPISRYRDSSFPSGGLTTSIVALLTDVIRDGRPVTGYGFASIGRFAQGGLIRERFAPRLLKASGAELSDESGSNLDPFRAWKLMMMGEKPGGHGERCVAVGTLDMALWDAAAKIAGVPLYRHLADRTGRTANAMAPVSVYASGGYYYPRDDIARLSDEVSELTELGFTEVKIKIGTAAPGEDLKRIEVAARLLSGADHLAVDAMNTYGPESSAVLASELARYRLWWLEDICDPLDFETLAAVSSGYPGAIAAGEALFSAAEAKLLDRYGGLRRDRDILLFDPVHCYGIPGYLQIIDHLEGRGWPRTAFWPHGGHLFCLHIVAALGLGGAEVNPLCFQPFGGYADDMTVRDSVTRPPETPGIGFEAKHELRDLFGTLHDT
jgi:D(-)-tartrate dehydratase